MNIKWGLSLKLIAILQSISSKTKPTVEGLYQNLHKFPRPKNIQSEIEAYLACKKLIDISIGLEQGDVKQFTYLYADVSFMYCKIHEIVKGHDPSIRSKVDEEFLNQIASAVKSYSSKEFVPDTSIDPQYAQLLRALKTTLFNENEYSTPTHPKVLHNESLNWPCLLEGYAKYFQKGYRNLLNLVINNKSSRIYREEFEGWDSIYFRAFRTMLEIAYPENIDDYGPIEEAIFLAIVDLALNPSIDSDFFLPEPFNANVQDFFPGHRFLKICRVLGRVKQITSEEISDVGWEGTYKRFISDVCICLGWEPPWIQAYRWINTQNFNEDFYHLYLFIECCKIRHQYPLFYGMPPYSTPEKGGGWWEILKKIPLPDFSGEKTAPIYSLNSKKIHDSVIGQFHVLQSSYILDQIMLESGPMDYTQIYNIYLDTKLVEGVIDAFKLSFSYNGINIDKISF